MMTMAMVSASIAPAATLSQPRYLLLPTTPPALARVLQPGQVLASEGDVSVIEVEFEAIDRLSEIVHEELGGCGGFLDVTEDVLSGTLIERIVFEEVTRRLTYVPMRNVRVAAKPEIERLVANASDSRYWDFLTTLTKFPDRSANSANGKKAAEFLRDQATLVAGGRFGFKAELIATGSGYNQPSVLITLPGTDPTLPGVLIGGHLDTFRDMPGADDDGSGSAVVMEALQTIVDSWGNFRNTVYFAWYAAEERGLVGSAAVVKHFKTKSIALKAVIQFDMVGYNHASDASDIYVITDNTDPTLTSQLKQLASIYTDAKVGETKCGYACSDHYNWTKAHIPTVMPFETVFSNINSQIHTPNDTLRLLDKAHAFRFVKLALAFLGENAGLISTR